MNVEATYKISVGPKLKAKIPHGSPYWREFNGSFDNREMPFSEFAGAIYNGHPFTTWHSNHWRDGKNYLLGHHLGIDFDTEDERSSIPYLMKDPFVQKYGSIIYTTPSHEIDAPRARVVFLLDQPIHQPQNYVAAATALLWLFSSADRQCKDPARFFYGAGPGADMELLPGRLPLSIIKDMIKRYQQTGQHEKRRVQHYEPRNTDEREVQDALKHINPWGIDYDQWLSILMALHSEFPGGNGMAMAEAWAQGYKGEVERKWRSFDQNGNGSGRVGIGTLFAIAKEQGYSKVNYG